MRKYHVVISLFLMFVTLSIVSLLLPMAKGDNGKVEKNIFTPSIVGFAVDGSGSSAFQSRLDALQESGEIQGNPDGPYCEPGEFPSEDGCKAKPKELEDRQKLAKQKCIQSDTVEAGDDYGEDVLCWYRKEGGDCTCPSGFSTSMPDDKPLEEELEKHVCVSGAEIRFPVAQAPGCRPCYASIDRILDLLVIDDTPANCQTGCGEVACGTSTQKITEEGTTLTCTCNWGGWQNLGNFQFVPSMGGG